MKRLSIKQFRQAYKVMRDRGYSPMAGLFCNKKDKKVCPIAALAYSTLKRLPSNLEMYSETHAVIRKFGVSEEYVEGIICGVDYPGCNLEDDDSSVRAKGIRLGIKLNKEFIA